MMGWREVPRGPAGLEPGEIIAVGAPALVATACGHDGPVLDPPRRCVAGGLFSCGPLSFEHS